MTIFSKFCIDLYKIENKNWKKTEDLINLTENLSGTVKSNLENNPSIINIKEKDLIKQVCHSEYTHTMRLRKMKKRILNIIIRFIRFIRLMKMGCYSILWFSLPFRKFTHKNKSTSFPNIFIIIAQSL